MAESRTRNAVKNIKSGVINNIINVITPFITRTVLLKVLGSDYLGLNGLFSSILQVLNMAELGFSSAIVFSLYRPLAEDDDKKVTALMCLYRKVYRIIGCAVFGIGICLLPFLKYLISGSYPIGINIYIIYLIYLANTSLSYFLFAYKGSLLTASQHQSVITNISSVLMICRFIYQIIVLLILRNYYIYLIGNTVYTVLYNIWVAYVVNRRYSRYFKTKEELDKETKFQIKQQIKGLIIGKISYISRNSFDSIVLSTFCGLTAVAVYSNYYYIFSAVLSIILLLGQSITAGIGNRIATESKESNYSDFMKFNFIYSWIGTWFSICLFCLYQPFMTIWAGESLTASFEVMLLFVLYFYITQMAQCRSVYATAAGLWWEIRISQIGEMVANITLNIILGYYFGMTGILLATIISVFVFGILMQTMIVFKCYFERTALNYYKSQIMWLVRLIIIGTVTYSICQAVSSIFNNQWIAFFANLTICALLPNIIITLFNKMHLECKVYEKDMIGYFTQFIKLKR